MNKVGGVADDEAEDEKNGWLAFIPSFQMELVASSEGSLDLNADVRNVAILWIFKEKISSQPTFEKEFGSRMEDQLQRQDQPLLNY